MRIAQNTDKPVAFGLMLASLATWLFLPCWAKENAAPDPAREVSFASSSLAEPDKGTQERLSEAYGTMPLSFEVNEGQAVPGVNFISRANGRTLFLTPTEAVLALGGAERTIPPDQPVVSTNSYIESVSRAESNPTVLRMKLAGANASAKVTGLDELPGKSNYFIGNDPKKWRANVANYARVKYEQVYDGVDLVYYGNQGQLEYDLIVTPRADYNRIDLEFESEADIRIDASGDLLIGTAAGDIRQRKPVAYQETGGRRKTVDARYVKKGPHQAGFEIARYDASAPLIIDPVLAYSTLLGGGGQDNGVGIAVDSAGSAYVTGFTVSSDFPLTPGAFQTARRSMFVTKINAAGSALVYSTYLGGTFSLEAGTGIAADSTGNAYVTGYTSAYDFPVTSGAFQTHNHSRFRSVFVTKLNPAGTGLVYSTYLGGNDSDIGRGIAVDLAGNAYVAGSTESDIGFSRFPVTPEAFQTTYGGGLDRLRGDAFVTKLNSDGTALVYSTYLGGSTDDAASGVAVDSAGNAYVTGGTFSANFPTTANAFQRTFRNIDAFVTKLDSSGRALIYSTFLGGSGAELGAAIAVDSSGSAYVTGQAGSLDFPITPGAVQPVPAGDSEIFITKLNALGNDLSYSTFLGGNDSDRSNSIAVDPAGNAYVTGYTFSTNFPTTPDAYQRTLRGGFIDAFVTKLNSTGTSLLYSTYLGGTNDEAGSSIVVDSTGGVYVTGYTGSVNFPTTPGAFKTGGGSEVFGFNDAFIVKFAPQFDICLQDETNGSFLSVNSATGDYQFSNCVGVTIGGIAAITRRGCLITLQVNGPDRRLLARIDTCMSSAIASIQVFSQGATFTIMDRNTANDTCACSR